jgi:hypothetical protein
MLEIGDVMVPPHGLAMCTGYDDAYNMTPARLLRQVRGLGVSREHQSLHRDEPLFSR